MSLVPSGLTALPTTGVPSQTQYRFVKASTAQDLDTQVERERAAIVAAFPDSTCTAFELMGAGAGAAFQVILGFNSDGATAVNMPLMNDCVFAFAGAREPSELLSETERVVTAAAAQNLLLFGQSDAGGGAGAEFVAGYAFASSVPAPGGGGLLLQACTAGMLEQQDITLTGLVDIEKQSVTSPGVRLQCELPSVQATSALRFSWIVQTSTVTVEGGGSTGILYRPFVSFPDDPIPDIRVTNTDVVVHLEPAAFVPQGGLGWSFLWPISSSVPFGGPPTGRVQYYIQAASVFGGDTIQFNGSGLGNTSGTPSMDLEEIANIVVQ